MDGLSIPPPFPINNLSEGEQKANIGSSEDVTEVTPTGAASTSGAERRHADPSDDDLSEVDTASLSSSDYDSSSGSDADTKDEAGGTNTTAGGKKRKVKKSKGDADVSVEKAMEKKEKGNEAMKTGDLGRARRSYRRGLRFVKGSSSDNAEVVQLRAALHANLCLVEFKEGNWWKAIRTADKTLKDNKSNMKVLYRRGVARSKVGLLSDAKEDLLKFCKANPTNGEARRELEKVKTALTEAEAKEKKAFKGLFAKGEGLYTDREREMAEKRRLEAEQENKLKALYDAERAAFYAEKKKAEEEAEDVEMTGQSGATTGGKEGKEKQSESKKEEEFEDFQTWKKKKEELEKEEKRKQERSNVKVAPRNRKEGDAAPSGEENLEEEEKKILEETKKMGYCYFNRKVEEPVPLARPMEASASQNGGTTGAGGAADSPGLATTTSAGDATTESKAISSWNAKGTTYEEKDVSAWAVEKLKQLFEKVDIQSPANPSEKPIHIKRVKVTSVESVEGEAQMAVVRGSLRYLYDLKCKVHFTITLEYGPDEIESQGYLSIFDISSTASVTDKSQRPAKSVDFLLRCKPIFTKKAGPAVPDVLQEVEEAVLLLKDHLYQQVHAFEEEYRKC